MAKGLVISGEFGNILVREKSGNKIELGELLIAETSEGKILMQVFDLVYGSQLSQQNLELVSGLRLEEDSEIELIDPKLRTYILSKLKNVLTIKNEKATAPKTLPNFFSEVRDVTKKDFSFMSEKIKNALYLGDLRSGSKKLEVPVYLDGEKVFSHHILICGTTGRGKSVLMSNLLWGVIDKEYCGMLVLDPHDEYYGRNKLGMKDHAKAKEKVDYYTPRNPPPGCKHLKFNIKQLMPHHFNGVVDWSDPQTQALHAYYKAYKKEWISSILLEKEIENIKFFEGTIAVIKRRLMQLLKLELHEETISCKGIFDMNLGEGTIKDIVKSLENAKTVILDTSEFSENVEILIGSLIASEVLDRYKNYNFEELKKKPVISVVIEEAPRVLGKEVLEKGHNIFSTIAREGRKFKVGLTAITQLPSLIPRTILANMNTKIILGIEMKPERQALIESASQDLSTDDRNIASLDKGEAIVSSNFANFAMPIKIPFFDLLVKNGKQEYIQNFNGIKP
ncbi:ATP-binding protein [Candidatus Woesearchaeota archaeon]|nr:ATP-binding protein [Candidatus Woesearchaeota archaeon]